MGDLGTREIEWLAGALSCSRGIEGEILGRMVYQVKLEIISTAMNFLCIVQVELSFMFVRGVTCNACSVKRKGRNVFPNFNWEKLKLKCGN